MPDKSAIDTVVEYAIVDMDKRFNEQPYHDILGLSYWMDMVNSRMREMYSRGIFYINLLNIPYYQVRMS